MYMIVAVVHLIFADREYTQRFVADGFESASECESYLASDGNKESISDLNDLVFSQPENDGLRSVGFTTTCEVDV